MANAKKTIGEELIASMQQALAHARGEKTAARVTTLDEPAVEVKRIREKVGFTQGQFAEVLGVSPSGLRKWEQNQRRPQGAALTLLRVMDMEPGAVVRAVTGEARTARRNVKRTAGVTRTR